MRNFSFDGKCLTFCLVSLTYGNRILCGKKYVTKR